MEYLKTAPRITAEFVGTALLVAGVVGSGIMAENLAGGNQALALLANALATGFLLPVLIQIFGPLSGAHFNPVVTMNEALGKRIAPLLGLAYATAQIIGGLFGILLAHAMFGEKLWQLSTHIRTGPGQWLSEIVATFGLALLILRRKHIPTGQLPWLVGAYIAAAYWFTASTSFANPAVTLARAFTDSFSGIRPYDTGAFIFSQIIGALGAYLFDIWIRRREAPHV